MAAGTIGSIDEGRRIVAASFPLNRFEPRRHRRIHVDANR
jgi:hypothetical protein